MRTLITIIALAAVVGIAPATQAAPLTWTVVNGVFTDQATLTGSFVYNADTDTVSDFHLTVSGGDTATFPGLTYAPGADFSGSGFMDLVFRFTDSAPNPFSVVNPDKIRVLSLSALSPLTNAGGIVPLVPLVGIDGSVECYNCTPFRLLTGSLAATSAAPVPEAGSLSLVAAGLALGFLRFRKLAV